MYSQNSNTHVCVRVVKLHHDVGRGDRRDLGVAKNLHLVEDERLVPGGIESVAHRHCFLGLMEERHNGVGVWGEKNQRNVMFEDLFLVCCSKRTLDRSNRVSFSHLKLNYESSLLKSAVSEQIVGKM